MLRLICAILMFSTSSWAADLYVSNSGNDSNPGTASAPLRTIQKAANAVSAGTTVHVAPGTYAENIYSTASGTASARIRYVSDTKWGAKIVPPSSGSSTAWDNRGSYVTIEGFEVDGQSKSLWVAGIYSPGSYDLIQGNHVHHIGTGATCSNQGGAGIESDYYYYGVKTDIIGNVVHDIGSATCNYIQGLYVATSGTVKNNLVYHVGAAAIHLWHDANDIVIANNTVFSSKVGIVVGGGEAYHLTGPADYIHVSNNIVIDSTYGIDEEGNTGTHNTYTNNLVYNNTYNWRLQNGLADSGTISADPQFVSYISTGSGDYHLKSTSPAIDKGASTDAPSTDLDGNPRPQGAGYDIGAYEYKSTTSTPAPTPLPTGAVTMTVSASQVTPGASVTVTISGAGQSAQEWLGLYAASAADADWSYNGNWMYLNGTQTQPTSPIGSATLTFKVPQDAGTYNIRLFASDDFSAVGNRMAISPNINVVAPAPTPAPAPADTLAPVTSITSPANGAVFYRGTTIQITAKASDNVGVKKVELYINGTLTCTNANSACSFKMANRRGVYYNLQTKAYDAAGNVGSSAVVTIRTK